MRTFPLPPDEAARLDDLSQYGILDTAAEEAFDALAKLATRLCDTPMAFINFLDSHRQWFKARIGIPVRETPREFSFCTYTILQPDEVTVISDALDDPRFRGIPLVTEVPHVRFYAGVPLVSPHGHTLGTLSVMDHEPRTLTREQLESLRLLADQVVSQLELRQRQSHLRQALQERESTARRLESARRELDNILETVPDIVYVLDEGGTIRRWNRQTERVTGYGPEELKARPALSMFPEKEHERVQNAINDTLRTGYGELEANLQRKDGETIPYWFTGRPLRNGRGDIIGLTGVGRDVTQQKRAEEALRNQRDRLDRLAHQLQEANRDLDAFARTVSHDLRAPLRAMEFISLVLLEDHGARMGPEGREHLQRQLAEEARMRRLIEDLLRLSQSTSSPLQMQPVDLARVAKDVVAELKARHPDRQVEVSVQDRVDVEGDPALLKVVLENLLGNAWKYTSKRRDARVEFGAQKVDGDAIVCFVRDNGAGFDQSHADRLFQPFQRLHGAEFEGTGVGLATVQRIIRRHGGRIWAQGEPQRGATFYFALSALPRDR